MRKLNGCRLKQLLVMGIALLLTSCIDFQQNITIYDDESWEAYTEIIIPPETVELAGGEEQIRDQFQIERQRFVDEMGSVETRTRLEKLVDGGIVVYQETTGNGLTLLNQFAFEGRADVVTETIQQQQQITIKYDLNNQNSFAEVGSFNVNITGDKIISSNADEIEGNTAKWHNPNRIEFTLVGVSTQTLVGISPQTFEWNWMSIAVVACFVGLILGVSSAVGLVWLSRLLITCPKCNNRVLAGKKFCASCGESLAQATATQTRSSGLPLRQIGLIVGGVALFVSLVIVGVFFNQRITPLFTSEETPTPIAVIDNTPNPSQADAAQFELEEVDDTTTNRRTTSTPRPTNTPFTSVRSTIPPSPTPTPILESSWSIRTGDISVLGVAADGTVYGLMLNREPHTYVKISAAGETLETIPLDGEPAEFAEACERNSRSFKVLADGTLFCQYDVRVNYDGRSVSREAIWRLTPSFEVETTILGKVVREVSNSYTVVDATEFGQHYDDPNITRYNNGDVVTFQDNRRYDYLFDDLIPPSFLMKYDGYGNVLETVELRLTDSLFPEWDGRYLYIFDGTNREFITYNAQFEVVYRGAPEGMADVKTNRDIRANGFSPWGDFWFSYPIFDALGNEVEEKIVKITTQGDLSFEAETLWDRDIEFSDIHQLFYEFDNSRLMFYAAENQPVEQYNLPLQFYNPFFGTDGNIYTWSSSTLTKYELDVPVIDRRSSVVNTPTPRPTSTTQSTTPTQSAATSTPRPTSTPTSAQGDIVVFSTPTTATQGDTVVFASPTPVPPTATPTLPPVQGKLAFVSDAYNGACEVAIVNLRTEAISQMTRNPACDWAPAFSSNSANLAYVSNFSGQAELYVMSSIGGAAQQITYDGSADDHPSWSSDGRVYFSSNRTGNWEIYRANSNGSGLEQLTNDGARDTYPAVSPDGQKVAFISDRDGRQNLYVMNSDGSNPAALVTAVNQPWSPAWSPNGQQLLFVSVENNNYLQGSIYRVNATGTGLEQLISSANGWVGYPTWSPYGGYIAYTRVVNNGSRDVGRIFYATVNGQQVGELFRHGNQSVWGVSWGQ